MQLTTRQIEKISAASYLVAGGAGFIGSHIAELLLDAGARKVRVLDNLSTGHFRNVAPFANHTHFEYIKGDIRDLETCKAACKGIDYVFHLATLGSGSSSDKYIVAANHVYTSGFLNMLLMAHEAKVKRFVYASGSPISGENQRITDINELYADQFARLSGMETIGLRYCHVFGQRHDAQSVYATAIPTFVMQLIRHRSPVINGTGEYCCCNYTYIKNVVQANMLAVLTTDPKAVNEVYNIAFEERTSLNRLAVNLKEFLSAFDKSIADVEIIYEAASEDIPHVGSLINKAKDLLGYMPRYSLRDGLLQSAGWYWAYLPQFEIRNDELKMKNEKVGIPHFFS